MMSSERSSDQCRASSFHSPQAQQAYKGRAGQNLVRQATCSHDYTLSRTPQALLGDRRLTEGRWPRGRTQLLAVSGIWLSGMNLLQDQASVFLEEVRKDTRPFHHLENTTEPALAPLTLSPPPEDRRGHSTQLNLCRPLAHLRRAQGRAPWRRSTDWDSAPTAGRSHALVLPRFLREPWHWRGALHGLLASGGGEQRHRPAPGWPGPP